MFMSFCDVLSNYYFSTPDYKARPKHHPPNGGDAVKRPRFGSIKTTTREIDEPSESPNGVVTSPSSGQGMGLQPHQFMYNSPWRMLHMPRLCAALRARCHGWRAAVCSSRLTSERLLSSGGSIPRPARQI